MEIERVTRTVFIGRYGQEFLTEQEAIDSIVAAGRKEAKDQLDDMISEAGGAYYDFNTSDVVDELVKNAELVIALIRKAAGLSEPRSDVSE